MQSSRESTSKGEWMRMKCMINGEHCVRLKNDLFSCIRNSGSASRTRINFTLALISSSFLLSSNLRMPLRRTFRTHFHLVCIDRESATASGKHTHTHKKKYKLRKSARRKRRKKKTEREIEYVWFPVRFSALCFYSDAENSSPTGKKKCISILFT